MASEVFSNADDSVTLWITDPLAVKEELLTPGRGAWPCRPPSAADAD